MPAVTVAYSDAILQSCGSLQEVRQHIVLARSMIEAAQYNIGGGYFATAVNHSHDAVFHAAGALLTTQGMARSKHSGVISAFRELFVKPGAIEPEYSPIYGRIMDRRHAGDYGLDIAIAAEQVEADMLDAARFLERIEQWLSVEGWL